MTTTSDLRLPRTEAGRRLLALDLKPYGYDMTAAVRAIEDEAAAQDNEGLRERIELLPWFEESDRIEAMNGTIRQPTTPADYVEAYRRRVLAALALAPTPASPETTKPQTNHRSHQ